jgi:alkanesulfonate monooxygenase SsuD/methylene tetrahydromethanopterin reductase-like flavin-dependent oxidoreductase (luciferase family)
MKVGISLSAMGRTGPDEVAAYARHAEDVGLDSLFVGDHLVANRPILDSVVTLATAAAVRSQIALGFGVLVVPLRPVAWVAKQIATLQLTSRGRVLLGVGLGGPASLYPRVGWEAVGVPYAERGRRLDEALEVLPELIAGRPARVSGAEITLAPSAQPPPFWVGGTADAALRRTARSGDAWMPSMVPPAWVPARAARLAELAAAHGRPAPEIAMGAAAALGPDVARSAIGRVVGSLTGGYRPPRRAGRTGAGRGQPGPGGRTPRNLRRGRGRPRGPERVRGRLAPAGGGARGGTGPGGMSAQP